jgi:DNA-binding XRE family transcriptional regulator
MSSSPAEVLAAKQPQRRSPRKTAGVGLRAPFNCACRELRESLGLTMGLVATEVGLSKTAYWQIEHGTEPVLSSALRIATFFGRPVESLWVLKGGSP